MKKYLSILSLTLVTILVFASCTTTSHIEVAKGVNFASYKTFSVTDSVDVIQDNRLYGRELSSFDSTVIASIGKTLQQQWGKKSGYMGHRGRGTVPDPLKSLG